MLKAPNRVKDPNYSRLAKIKIEIQMSFNM